MLSLPLRFWNWQPDQSDDLSASIPCELRGLMARKQAQLPQLPEENIKEVSL